MKTETLKEAGYYELGLFDEEPGLHILVDKDGKMELWAERDSVAGYALQYGDKVLEFCRTLRREEVYF